MGPLSIPSVPSPNRRSALGPIPTVSPTGRAGRRTHDLRQRRFAPRDGQGAGRECASACSRSSRELTLKKGSTGAAGHSASARGKRPSKSSTLRSPSSTSARRISEASPTGTARPTWCVRPPRRRRRSSPLRRAGPHAAGRPDGRGERRVGRQCRHIGHVGAALRQIFEAGQNAGERPGEIGRRWSGPAPAGRSPGEARRIAVGADRQSGDCGRSHPIAWAINGRPASRTRPLSAPPRRRPRPPSSTRPRVDPASPLARPPAR